METKNDLIQTLEADGIELSYGDRKLLSDVYLKCETQKTTALLGRNGEGKTSLFNIIYGSLKPLYGSIRINGNYIRHAYKNPKQLTYLPQFNFIPKGFSLKRVFDDFELSLSDFENVFPDLKGSAALKVKNLSGGQRRLLEVYLIIKSKSSFSILDEPFSHVMPLHIEKISALIATQKKQKGFLISDHLFEAVINISDTIYVLKDGKTHLVKRNEDIVALGYAKFNSPT